MDVWQRGTSLTVTSGYTADGWIVVATGASVTVNRVVSGATAALSPPVYWDLCIVGATSVTDVLIKQRIESYVAAALCGQTVTVQAYVWNNTGATITPKLTVNHANAVDDWTAFTTDVNAVSLQACVNAAWTQAAYTFTAAANMNGLEVIFDFGNNFAGASPNNRVYISACDIRSTPGVSVGINNSPPPVEIRPIGIEMPFNQRYYWRWAPGSTTSAINIFQAFNATQYWGKLFDLPTPMRAVPVCNISSLSHFDSMGAKPVTAVDFTGTKNLTISTWNGWTSATATYAALNAIMVYVVNTAAWIDASAEL
jgi:hypothetical protein